LVMVSLAGVERRLRDARALLRMNLERREGDLKSGSVNFQQQLLLAGAQPVPDVPGEGPRGAAANPVEVHHPERERGSARLGHM